ncbi:MAG: methenyltetrahydromethanopterin cyclohydrolase [Pirellulaceae bacterium]
MSLNEAARQLCDRAITQSNSLRIAHRTIAGATVLDAGVESPGSLAAGLLLARVCLGDAADVRFVVEDSERHLSDIGISVRTDQPLLACLGGQYAGWPVQTDDYFAMGSGPMRMCRGREEMLQALSLRETTSTVVGVLEADKLPSESVIETIARDCQTSHDHVTLCVAPSTSLAGTVQVVARSVETAMHKLHARGFDVNAVLSGWGVAPLPPMAKPGDAVGGIGRTNDAILYGGRVTLWVDAQQEQVDEIGPSVPSVSSPDHGRPFAEIFKDYGYDFYQVDPHLFSPAVVTIVNLRSGIARRFGEVATDVLRRSFGVA